MTDMQQDANSTQPVGDSQWTGFTLEQLRMLRAKALLRRELGKVRINTVIDGMRTRVSDNGLRGLMFSNKTIGRLKAADYVFLGWKVAQLLVKARRRTR